MNTDWIQRIICGFLVIFTAGGCEFFTNDPGLIDPKVENNVDLSIANVQAPVSALVGDEIPIQVVLQNRGTIAITQQITITAIHQQSDSVFSELILKDGINADSAIAFTINWNTLSSKEGTHSIVIKHDIKDMNPSNNSRLVNLTLTDQQDFDLSITTMSVPSEINRGEVAQIQVTLRNVGSEEINNDLTLYLFRDSEENVISFQTSNEDIESGESRTFVFAWNTENETPGEHEIIALHDFEDNTSQNNRGSLPVTIIENEPVEDADLAITELEAPSEAEQGDEVQIIATIRNNGNTEIDEDVEFVLENETTDDVLEVIDFEVDLEAGESEDLTFTWDTEDMEGGEYTISVSHNFEDSSSDNNMRTVVVNIEESLLFDVSIVNFNGPSVVARGDEAGLNFTISNTGQIPISDDEINIEVTDLTDGSMIESRRLDTDMDVGESHVIDIPWDTGESTVGEHSLRVSQDLEDDNRSNNNRDLIVFVQEPDLNFSVEEFDPDKMEKDEEEEIRISGTGFTEGVIVDFFREEGDKDDKGNRRDDDDDDDDDDTPKPIIIDNNYIDENTIIITVRTRWWGRKEVKWNARLTHPNGEVIEFKDALEIKDD